MTNAATALYKALHKKRAYTKLYWDVANAIGINQALLIEIVERWCELNREKGKSSYYQQGEWWTSATYQEWAEKYPALGGWKSIQRVFLGLEKDSYILSGRFTKGSQAKYYRVNPEAIGELLLTGTLKDEIGIVSKSDGIVSDSDSTISKMDGIVSKSDGTVSDLDVPLYIDQIIQKDHSNIPPNPPTEGIDVEVSEKIASLEEESGLPTEILPSDQPCQPSNSNNDKPYPEDKNSAALCYNKAARKPEGDKHFGAVRQQNYQRSLAARIQQGNVIPISEYEIWESPAEYEEFEEYLLSQVSGATWCQNPASYVASKLKAIATGKEPATELKQWRKDKQESATAKPQAFGQPRQLTQEEQDAEAEFLAEMRSPDFHSHLRRPNAQELTTDARSQSAPSRSSLRSRLFGS